MIRQNPYTLAQNLAQECYERYKADYEGRHRVTLDAWSTLAREIQGRWVAAVKPVAEKLCDAAHTQEDLEDARTLLQRLQDDENRASARRRALPDMIALASVPGPLAELLGNLATALGESEAKHEAERAVAV